MTRDGYGLMITVLISVTRLDRCYDLFIILAIFIDLIFEYYIYSIFNKYFPFYFYLCFYRYDIYYCIYFILITPIIIF